VVPYQIYIGQPDYHPKWQLLLKIRISLIDHYCINFVKITSTFNCSCMTMSISTFMSVVSAHNYFQLIYVDYANEAYLDKNLHEKSSSQNNKTTLNQLGLR
jgi:hypothetical protein